MIEVVQYVDVAAKARQLDCNDPEGIAILPRNFATATSKSSLLHEDTAPTVRVLWRQAGIAETPVEKSGDKFPYIKERSSEWVGPIILFGASVYTGNPTAINIALSVIANYLTEFFRGTVGAKKATLGIVVPDPNTNQYSLLKYEGDVEGLKELPAVIKALRNGRPPARKKAGRS